MLLEVADLEVGYTPDPVLRQINLSVDAGEVVTVLGANGAGKSTLLRAISGLLTLRAGDVSLGGRSLRSLRPHEIVAQGIAHVLESRGILPSLSVRENILLGTFAVPRRRHAGPRAIDLATSLFPWIGKRLNQLGGELSGGEQQMVAISRALAGNPQVLLLDEPSQGLAPLVVADIFSKLATLAGPELSILIVEQYVHKALELAQRAYVLRRGEVIASGTADDLRNQRIEELYFS